MNWFCSKDEEKGAAITQSYSNKSGTSENSIQWQTSQRSFTHPFYTKVLPHLTIFPRIMLVQNYNKEDLGFGVFFMITLFLNKLQQCRPCKICTSAFSFNSPLNPSTLPLPALWDTAAHGGVRKLLHMLEAKVLKTVSCSLQRKRGVKENAQTYSCWDRSNITAIKIKCQRRNNAY